MCTNVKEMVIKTKTRQEQSADTWIAKVGYKLKSNSGMAVGLMIWRCDPYKWIMVIDYTQHSFLDFCWDITSRLEYSKFQQDNFQCFWKFWEFCTRRIVLGDF